jgi:3-oxoacyl-[acyl-carrier protein] reductase
MMLQGRVAIVTGAAQGIGRAIAESLAQAGADVAVADLDPGRSSETVQAIEKAGRKALNVKVNVADANDAKAMVDQVLKAWGKVDILVNNAGITRDGLLLRMKEEDWDLVLQVNLNGTFHCTKAALQPMTKQRYGRIVNIASIVGVMGNAGQANYAASKAAVIGFTKTVGREYAGIHRHGHDARTAARREGDAAEANPPRPARHAGGHRRRRPFSGVRRRGLHYRTGVARERRHADGVTSGTARRAVADPPVTAQRISLWGRRVAHRWQQWKSGSRKSSPSSLAWKKMR